MARTMSRALRLSRGMRLRYLVGVMVRVMVRVRVRARVRVSVKG